MTQNLRVVCWMAALLTLGCVPTSQIKAEAMADNEWEQAVNSVRPCPSGTQGVSVDEALQRLEAAASHGQEVQPNQGKALRLSGEGDAAALRLHVTGHLHVEAGICTQMLCPRNPCSCNTCGPGRWLLTERPWDQDREQRGLLLGEGFVNAPGGLPSAFFGECGFARVASRSFKVVADVSLAGASSARETAGANTPSSASTTLHSLCRLE